MLYFGLPAILILPPTLLMGFSFPILQRLVQTDFARLGRRIGLLMLANIGGSVVGTIVTGWVALDLLGHRRHVASDFCAWHGVHADGGHCSA